MQRKHQQIRRQATPKKSHAPIARIVDLVKSPEFQFDWPEFLASEADMEEAIPDYLALRRVIDRALSRLPPNLKRHLRHLMNTWHDNLSGKALNFEASPNVSADPLWAKLPPSIQMFETGHPVSLMVARYQEIRQWHEILAKIAKGQFGFYLGDRILGFDDANGSPITERDELTRALYKLEDWRKIRECKKCSSIYLETRRTYGNRVVEASCPPPAKCRQRIRRERNPRKPRPPSRLEEFRAELMRYCKREKPQRIVINPETIDTLSQYTDFRPSTIKKCLEWLDKERREKEAGLSKRVTA